MQADIRIYVCTQKPVNVPDNPLFQPIQVGAALMEEDIEGYLRDDGGENISGRNGEYCELTAQYWAWKNVDCDYYGFFHCSGYLSFCPESWNGEDTTEDLLLPRTAAKHGLDDAEQMRALITAYDLVTVRETSLDMTVWQHYEENAKKYHHIEDLQTTLDVIKETAPQFVEAAREYLDQKKASFGNMFIMKKTLFHDYCAWLFPILEEVEKRIDRTHWGVHENRMPAFLAEHLYGIYLTWLKKETEIRTKALPMVSFRIQDIKQTLPPIFPTGAVPVVLAANDTFAPYLCVAVASIIACAGDAHIYDIIVLHTNISVKNQTKIQTMARGKANVSIRFFDVSFYMDGVQFFEHEQFTPEAYFRFFIQDVLQGYTKTIYLDCDLVVLHDLAALFRIDVGDNYVAATRDFGFIGQYRFSKEHSDYVNNEVQLKNPFDYFQSGVMLLNLTALRAAFSSQQYVALAVEKKRRYPDQDVMNILFESRVAFLPFEWNLMAVLGVWENTRHVSITYAPRVLYRAFLKACENPYIVHYASTPKPWQAYSGDLGELFWQYARSTPYYEEILATHLALVGKQGETQAIFAALLARMPPEKQADLTDFYNSKVVLALLPKDSRRRAFVKASRDKLFPKGSRRRNVIKKIAVWFIPSKRKDTGPQ